MPRLRGKTHLVTSFLILSWLVTPILGLQSSSQNISSWGTIEYPKHELGVWHAEMHEPLPKEVEWVVTPTPTYVNESVSVLLNRYGIHPPYLNDVRNDFRTVKDLKTVESELMTVPAENFWGIIGVPCEEHYKVHVQFDDDVNTTWFGERLLGYPLYLQLNPTGTEDEWRGEMFLRMIRGFYKNFHNKTKVGITVGASAIIENWRNQGWFEGIPKYFGEPAFAYIKEHYDFVILYAYTDNLPDFQNWTRKYFTAIDNEFQKQKKFWVLTRIWDRNKETWEPEVIALEMKNCLDRNIVTTCYYWNNPPLNETWDLINRAIELYDGKAPYFEDYVYGENLLTEHVGNTYGWVKV